MFFALLLSLQAGDCTDTLNVTGRYLNTSYGFAVRNPHNPRSLAGLAAALRRQKKDARAATADLRRWWKGETLSPDSLPVILSRADGEGSQNPLR